MPIRESAAGVKLSETWYNLSLPGEEHDAGLPALAFQQGKHRIGGRNFGNGELDVQPLRDGDGEVVAPNRFDRDPIHGDEIAFEVSEIDVVCAHRRGVNDKQ